jgi:NAD(P)-dependent dehydrogenase (short-subunit alcohol dehydrogenase family)
MAPDEPGPTAGGSDELAGKVAIVTGAAGGIGQSVASLLARAGASVMLADLPGDRLEQAVDEVRAVARADVAGHPVDIGDEVAVSALIDATVETFGGLGILINNAALLNVADDTDVLHANADSWQRLLTVNVIGTMLMCKHGLPPMIDAGRGSIVNLTSTMANQGDFFATGYACTKGALQTLTRFVATQCAGAGVRCNAIAPGLVRTPALAEGMSAEMQAIFAESHLVGRLAEPQEVAEMALFLASDRASFITGQVLAVDGGFTAHAPTILDVQRALAT